MRLLCVRVVVRGEGVMSEGVRGENDNDHGHVVTV